MSINAQTIEKMRRMKLSGMAQAFSTSIQSGKANECTIDEMVALLVTSEWDERCNQKIERSIRQARFRYKASIEQINTDNARQLDKNFVMRLADGSIVKQKENVIITGSTGTGKSFLASAIGHEICLHGYKVLYHHSPKLFAKLKIAKVDGSYLKELAHIEKQDLLIIDDFGIHPLDTQNRTSLMEIIEDRHGKSSTIFTSQAPVHKWHDIIGEQTIADAILDRLVHDAHRLELKGESMRRKKVLKSEEEMVE